MTTHSVQASLTNDKIHEILTTNQALFQAVVDYLTLSTAAKLQRDRVDAYIRPIFNSYRFRVKPQWVQSYGYEYVQPCNPICDKNIYLSDDDEMCKQYYTDCDKAHRQHGFEGAMGCCPALIAEHKASRARANIFTVSAPLFNISRKVFYGTDIDEKWVDGMIDGVIRFNSAEKIKSACLYKAFGHSN